MKKIIIILSVILVLMLVIIGGLGFSAQKSSVYKVQEQVDYDQILDDEGSTIYYYYQDTCHYCNNIKPQLKDFTSIINKTDGIEFKLVDMKTSKNQNAWYDWETHNKIYGENTSPSLNPAYKSEASQMKTVDDVKITGTPTAVYVKDGVITDYKVGEEVFDVFETVEEEFNLDYTFDKSQYSKS